MFSIFKRRFNFDKYDKVHSEELWGLDYTLCRFIIPRLKELKRTQHGFPSKLNEVEWDFILFKMIVGFEAALMLSEDDFGISSDLTIDEYFKQHRIATDEAKLAKTIGLRLFAKHFSDLWD